MFDYNPRDKRLVQLRAVKNHTAPIDIQKYVERFVNLVNSKEVSYATT